jgi:DNA gyrase subunit A
VIGVVGCGDRDVVVVATRDGHVMTCKAEEIGKLEGPGRGVTVIKLDDDNAVIAFLSGAHKSEVLEVETDKGGKRFELHADPKQVTARGGKGHQIVKRATLVAVQKPVAITPLATADGGEGVH